MTPNAARRRPPAHPRSCADHPVDAAFLAGLVAELDDHETGLDVDGPPAYALAVRAAPRDGRRVARWLGIPELLGWTAPRWVDAIAVVAGGRTTSADSLLPRAPARRGLEVAAGQDVRVVIAAARDGSVAGRMRIDGRVANEPPAGGRLLDAVFRALGVRTPPPPTGTAGLLAALWLGALAGLPPRPRALTWREVLGQHPVGGAFRDDEPDATAAELEAGIRCAATVWTWDRLRVANSERGSLDGLCPKELSGWMDDGMFARWVLGSMVPPAPLLPPARAAMTAEAWDRLTGLLGLLGLADLAGEAIVLGAAGR